jgi:uncharacterized protein YggE
MKLLKIAAAACLIALGGCTTLASGISSVATSLSTASPTQVSTYADATIAADIATRTVDLAVQTGKLNKATLTELAALNDAVHAAWLDLKAANDAGKSLTFASFNAALSAFEAYRAAQGISEASSPSS